MIIMLAVCAEDTAIANVLMLVLNDLPEYGLKVYFIL